MQGPPPNFAHTINPYANPPYDPYQHLQYPISSPPHVQPSLAYGLPPSTTSTSTSTSSSNFTPNAPSFTPSAQPFVPRSSSTSPLIEKRSIQPSTTTTSTSTTKSTNNNNKLLDSSAKTFSPSSQEDFPSLGSSSSPVKTTKGSSVSAPTTRSNSIIAASSSKSNSTTKGTNGKIDSPLTKKKNEIEGEVEEVGEVDLDTLVDQLYQAAEQMKKVKSQYSALSLVVQEKEKELKQEMMDRKEDQDRFVMEQDRYLKEMEEWEKESKRLKKLYEEQQQQLVDLKKEQERVGNGKGKNKVSEDDGFLTKIHRGVQVDPLLSLSLPPLPIAPTPPSRPETPAVASTSTGSPLPELSELSTKTLQEYQTLLTTVQTRLTQVESEKLSLDHRIAQMVQEKESLWPEQRQVLIQKAETEKREIEKKLEKALKRVEVLEKDRPAPVLRIGSGPPKFVTPQQKKETTTSTSTSSTPDPRLAQLEARLAEVESDLTEATSRAISAEESLEDYQTRTDKLLGEQQTSIDSLIQQKEKLQEQIHLSEKQIASIKKKAKELNDSHQSTLLQRKSAEDEARNEMLRLKDQLKEVLEELEKEKLKSTRDLAANERRKIEAKHQSVRDADKQRMDEAGLSHGEELGDLEYQLRDETEQHAREIESLNKKHEAEMNALRTQLDAVTESEKGSASNGSNSSGAPLSSTILPGAAKPSTLTSTNSTNSRGRKSPPRSKLSDQSKEKQNDLRKLGEELAGLSSL
ncbi:hypothetical protein JCM5350_005890 [Sporobolomyces pararoseus]